MLKRKAQRPEFHLQNPHHISWVWWHDCDLSFGEAEAGDSWSSLTSQPSLLGKSQTSEAPS